MDRSLLFMMLMETSNKNSSWHINKGDFQNYSQNRIESRTKRETSG
jgi:hypothetical protein